MRVGSLEICQQSLKIWVISKRTIFGPPTAGPPLSYHFCIWGSHMYHMDIGHVAAALGPLAYPRRSAQPPSLS